MEDSYAHHLASAARAEVKAEAEKEIACIRAEHAEEIARLREGMEVLHVDVLKLEADSAEEEAAPAPAEVEALQKDRDAAVLLAKEIGEARDRLVKENIRLTAEVERLEEQLTSPARGRRAEDRGNAL